MFIIILIFFYIVHSPCIDDDYHITLYAIYVVDYSCDCYIVILHYIYLDHHITLYHTTG